MVWSRTGLPVTGLCQLPVVPVGGHCRATFQIAHMKGFFYLRVSGGLLLRWTLHRRCCYQHGEAVALPSHVSSKKRLAQFILLRKQMTADDAGLMIIFFALAGQFCHGGHA